MRKHLSPAELRQIDGSLGPSREGEAHRHLLLCRQCRKRAFARLASDPGETWEPPAASPASSPEGRILGRALALLHRRLGTTWAGEEGEERLFTELLAHPVARRLTVLVEDSRFARPGIAHRLLEAAEARTASDPMEAEHLATSALHLAKRLPFPWTGLERDALLGRSRTLEAETWRARGELEKAEEAAQAALHHLNLIPPASLERASFCLYLARLRKDQGRDDEALALLARAADLFEDLAEPQKVAGCRLEQGWLHLGELESAEALLAFEEAAAWWADPDSFEPWLSARHGLALCLADLHLAARARALVRELAEVAAGRSRRDQLRVAVVEAEVAQALDANEHAASRLGEAWRGLIEEGAVVEGVLAGLDLARLYAEEGRSDRIGRLAGMLGSVQSLRPPLGEVVSFVLSFVSLHGLPGIEVLEQGRSFLARAQHNPDLPFRPVGYLEREVGWAHASRGLRHELAVQAGLSVEVAARTENDILPRDRRRLAWAAEAAKGVRLVFSAAPKAEGGEAVH